MSDPATLPCNAFALRSAARHLSQFYDGMLAPLGLRTTQFSILARLQASGPWSIHALAERLVMDRTTLGRNIRPLERDGLLVIGPDPRDRRSRALSITPKGVALLEDARRRWGQAQARFESSYGPARAAELRAALRDVTSLQF
jgi:DNA-binding MarR family transcriptional regulator